MWSNHCSQTFWDWRGKAKICHDETLRRKLHNTIMALKGNICVFSRIRPLISDAALGNGGEISHIYFQMMITVQWSWRGCQMPIWMRAWLHSAIWNSQNFIRHVIWRCHLIRHSSSDQLHWTFGAGRQILKASLSHFDIGCTIHFNLPESTLHCSAEASNQHVLQTQQHQTFKVQLYEVTDAM